jgi:peptide-methionine (S)-S-oxide reductase
VQLDFDPAQVSYADLLRVFWQSHHPDARSWSRQYQAIIFYHSAAQKELAEKTRAEVAARLGRPVYTEIVPAKEFYPAEDYHQKFYLTRVGELLREYQTIYPDFQDFVNSTAVARANGYAAGYGAREQLTRELDSLGLSQSGRNLLLELVPAGRQEAPQELCPVK